MEGEDAVDSAKRFAESITKGLRFDPKQVGRLNKWFKLQHEQLLRYQLHWEAFYGADNASLAKALSVLLLRLLGPDKLATFGNDWEGQALIEQCVLLFKNFITFTLRLVETDISRVEDLDQQSIDLLSTKPLCAVNRMLFAASDERCTLWMFIANNNIPTAERTRMSLINHILELKGMELLSRLSSDLLQRDLCSFASLPQVLRLVDWCTQQLNVSPDAAALPASTLD